MTDIAVSKKVLRTLCYFAVSASITACCSIGATIKLNNDIVSYRDTNTSLSQQLNHATTEIEQLKRLQLETNKHLADKITENNMLKQQLAAKKVAAITASREADCMAKAIYFEARGEVMGGKKAVGTVIYNRMKSKVFPATACGVVYQRIPTKRGVNKKCQFSWTCDGAADTIDRSSNAWLDSKHAAVTTLLGNRSSIVGNALYFHNGKGKPHARTVFVARVGNHKFYR